MRTDRSGSVQQPLDVSAHGEVAAFVQHRHGPRPHLGSRVRQQPADHRVRGAGVTRREQFERVENALRIVAAHLRGEDFGGRLVEYRDARALDVTAVFLDALPEVRDVLPLCDPGGREPPGQEQQVHPGDLRRGPLQAGGQQQDDEAREPVTEAPDHRVDERLDLQRLLPGERQVQQLRRGPVNRVTKHLIAAAEHDHRRERARDQQAHRPERQRDRHHRQRHPQAEPAQQT